MAIASTELGHHPKTVYMSQDGQLIVPSSAVLKVEGGGVLTEKPSSAYTSSGAGSNIPNRGVTIIRSTDVVGLHILAQPTTKTIGVTKHIFFDTTAEVKLTSRTVAATFDVRMGTSVCCIQWSTDAGKLLHKTNRRYGSISLYALSTSRWLITNLNPDDTGAKYWVMSSST